MARFHFTLADENGATTAGVLEAEDRRAALRALAGQGTVIAVAASSPMARVTAALSADIGAGRRLALADQIVIARALASLLHAGLTIETALKTIEAGEFTPRIRRIARDLRARARQGERLASALARVRPGFDGLFSTLVALSEQTGRLAEAFVRIAESLEERRRVRGALAGALAYPAVILFTFSLAILFILVFVVPQIRALSAGPQEGLSFATRILFLMSDLAAASVYVLPVALAGLLALAASLRVNGALRIAAERAALRLPLAGRLIRDAHAARIAQMLSVCLRIGMPAAEALSTCRDGISAGPWRQALETIASRTRAGAEMSHGFAAHPRLFPPLLLQMIAVGERTSDLPRLLDHAASAMAEDLDKRRKSLINLVTPVCLLVFGAVIGFIMFAIWSTILDLNTLVLE